MQAGYLMKTITPPNPVCFQHTKLPWSIPYRCLIWSLSGLLPSSGVRLFPLQHCLFSGLWWILAHSAVTCVFSEYNCNSILMLLLMSKRENCSERPPWVAVSQRGKSMMNREGTGATTQFLWPQQWQTGAHSRRAVSIPVNASSQLLHLYLSGIDELTNFTQCEIQKISHFSFTVTQNLNF